MGEVAAAERLMPALAEPTELLASIRQLSRQSPARARATAPKSLAAYAWESWRAVLEESDLELVDVEAAFSAARREIWLWVKGNRVWAQLSVHLAGRVARRRD